MNFIGNGLQQLKKAVRKIDKQLRPQKQQNASQVPVKNPVQRPPVQPPPVLGFPVQNLVQGIPVQPPPLKRPPVQNFGHYQPRPVQSAIFTPDIRAELDKHIPNMNVSMRDAENMIMRADAHFQQIGKNFSSPQERNAALAEMILNPKKLDNIQTSIMDMHVRLQQAGVDMTGKTVPQVADIYLDKFGTLSDDNKGGAFHNESAMALSLKYGGDNTALSQKMSKQMEVTAEMGLYQGEVFKKGFPDYKTEADLKYQMTKQLQQDGMCIVPILAQDKNNLSETHGLHAMYGVVKRNEKGGLDIHIQNTWKGQKELKAEIIGGNDEQCLDRLMLVMRGCGNYKMSDGHDAEKMLTGMTFAPFKDNNGQEFNYGFNQIFKNVEMSQQGLNWGQIKGNCHLSGLTNAVDVAARLNETNPTMDGLTRETLNKDVKKLELADEAGAGKAFLQKFQQSQVTPELKKSLNGQNIPDKENLEKNVKELCNALKPLYPSFSKQEISEIAGMMLSDMAKLKQEKTGNHFIASDVAKSFSLGQGKSQDNVKNLLQDILHSVEGSVYLQAQDSKNSTSASDNSLRFFDDAPSAELPKKTHSESDILSIMSKALLKQPNQVQGKWGNINIEKKPETSATGTDYTLKLAD